MTALRTTSGQLEIHESDKPVLRYNYATVEPGVVLQKVTADNQKYARPRSDYIHPIFGPDGEELTKDWSVDHPHHRGIYWAWPEVDYQGERGDLHALQRVFARPTGKFELRSGADYAEIEAENLWRWEDREPIVREHATIRAHAWTPKGRWLDLQFQFTALSNEVSLARRGMAHYGGLNVRLATVQNQKLEFTNAPSSAHPRVSWGRVSGEFPRAKSPLSFVIFQHQDNPHYPGDWIQYPELNWLQPTFPASGTRHVLKPNQPLVLKFRFWITPDPQLSREAIEHQWRIYHHL